MGRLAALFIPPFLAHLFSFFRHSFAVFSFCMELPIISLICYGSWLGMAAYLRVGGEDHPDRLTRRLDLLVEVAARARPQRVVQRQVLPVVRAGLGGGCVRVVLQQPAHHTNRRPVVRRGVQRQPVSGLLGAGLRARRP